MTYPHSMEPYRMRKYPIAPCRHMSTAIRRTIEIVDEIDEVIEL